MSAREINMLSLKVSELADRINGMDNAGSGAPPSATIAFDEDALMQKIVALIDLKISVAFNEELVMQKVDGLVNTKIASAFNEEALMQKVGVLVDAKVVGATSSASLTSDTRRSRKGDVVPTA